MPRGCPTIGRRHLYVPSCTTTLKFSPSPCHCSAAKLLASPPRRARSAGESPSLHRAVAFASFDDYRGYRPHTPGRSPPRDISRRHSMPSPQIARCLPPRRRCEHCSQLQRAGVRGQASNREGEVSGRLRWRVALGRASRVEPARCVPAPHAPHGCPKGGSCNPSRFSEAHELGADAGGRGWMRGRGRRGERNAPDLVLPHSGQLEAVSVRPPDTSRRAKLQCLGTLGQLRPCRV